MQAGLFAARRRGPSAAVQALGRLPPGAMNGTEQAYSGFLASLMRDGKVLWFLFEPFNLKLAPKTFYSPDFLVMQADRSIELHEVKGFWQDDARVKIKVAADKFPLFRFVAVKAKAKRDGGGWSEEEI